MAWPERVVHNTELYRQTDGKQGGINTRSIVTAVPGHVLVGADLSAAELRLYVMYSGDKVLTQALKEGKDLHSLNYAALMARTPAEIDKWYAKVEGSKKAVRKYLRNIAKRAVFLRIYGGQKELLYKTMSTDRNPDGTKSFPDLKPQDVDMWMTNWDNLHPEMVQWQESVVRAWYQHGYVASIIDQRKRYFIGGLDKNAIINHGVQSATAAITNKALLAIAEQCPHRGWSQFSGPVLQVHDFLGLQVPVERQKEAEELLNTLMPFEHRGVQFTIEQKSGPSWDEL
jgi:DNA polymerase I-like protein with 3'-5' exonuclease and polymerase domains